MRVVVKVNTFNNLIELLVRYADKTTNEYKEKAEQIKNKLLKYSIPKTGDETIIDIGFFNNEAADLLYILLSEISEFKELSENYFNQLIKNRER